MIFDLQSSLNLYGVSPPTRIIQWASGPRPYDYGQFGTNVNTPWKRPFHSRVRRLYNLNQLKQAGGL